MNTKIELNKFITKTLVDVAIGVTRANDELIKVIGEFKKYLYYILIGR